MARKSMPWSKLRLIEMFMTIQTPLGGFRE